MADELNTSLNALLTTNFGLSPSGYTGSRGVAGYTGSDGYTGSVGSVGPTGFTGSIGFSGSQGNTGLGFAIAKSYATVAALTADTAPTGIAAGQFAIIETGSVDDPDNSKLYLWSGTAYSYVTDLSGAAGITGPAGSAGFTGSAGVGFTGSGGTGFTGSAGVGFTGSGGTGFTGSAGAGGVITATASGSITAGRAVKLNTDATVSMVGATTVALAAVSSNTQFTSVWAFTSPPAVAYDTANNRIYVAYANPSTGRLNVVVGVPTGTSITWGTPADSTISVNSTRGVVSCAFDVASQRLVVTYSSSSITQAVVCTFVSGPSVTFGTAVQIFAGLSYTTHTIYDTAAGRTVSVYKFISGGVYTVSAVVGTVSGTSITFGSPTTVYTASSSSTDVGFDVAYNTNGSNIVVAYAEATTGSAKIGTVSGTSISFGTAAIFNNASTTTTAGALSVTYDSGSQRILVAYTNASNNGFIAAGSISGTAITFGTSTSITLFGSAVVINYLTIAYDASVNRTFLGLFRSSDNYHWGADVTVSNLTVSAPSQTLVDATNIGATSGTNSIFLGGTINRTLYITVQSAGAGAAFAVLVKGYEQTSNSAEWFGLAAGTYTNGQAAAITVLGGVNTNQSALTANTIYYVSATGTLTSTDSGYGKVGVALSSTAILVTAQTVTGFVGSAGSAGFVGSSGTVGFTGSAGTAGSAGFTGSGGTGFTGSIGSAGFTGSFGTTGFAGSTGFTGSTGVGFAGSTGFTGSTGTGFTGSAGTAGAVGFTGSAGTGGSGSGNGFTGSQGIPGSLASGQVTNTFAGNGSTTAFTLSVAPVSKDAVTVNIDGVTQQRSDYTLSGFVLTLDEAPFTGETVEVTIATYGTTNFVTRTYTADGVTANYAVTLGATVNSVIVTENGVVQTPGTDYTITGNVLAFVGAPAAGVAIGVREIPSGSISSNSIYSRTAITATAGQITFAVAYNVGFLEVYFNGALLNAIDYTATNGSTVVLTLAAAAGDIVEFITYNAVPILAVPVATFNSTNMSANLAITAGYSAVSVGPISVAAGVSISIADGQKWVIL
jgi:collagen type VII alpha